MSEAPHKPDPNETQPKTRDTAGPLQTPPLPGDPADLLKLGLTATASGGTGPRGGFIPPTVEELKDAFPNLKVLELLGRGGMGAVYKARQPGLDRLVAVKVLPPQIVTAPGFTERFAREARALAKLNHPNIVAVYDFGEAKSLYYIVMEFVDGANIRQTMQSGKLSPVEAMAIVPQICEALQYAHNEGIVHRDIKPENILIDKKGRVKIADFGLAKLMEVGAVDYTLTAEGGTMGTLHYMAPEQIGKAHTVDHRADIYSLGVVFYEMLTGELPMGRFAPPSQKVQVDVRLDEIVLHALERDVERRYQHVSEIKTDMAHVTAKPNVATAPSPTTVKRPMQRAQVSAFSKVFAVLAVGTMGSLLIGASTHPVSLWTVLIALLSLGAVYWSAFKNFPEQRMLEARKAGLWPALGEVPTLEQVKLLAQSDEKILAIRLFRQMHPVGLAEAKAIVEKLAGPKVSWPDANPKSAPPPAVPPPAARGTSQLGTVSLCAAIWGVVPVLLAWSPYSMGSRLPTESLHPSATICLTLGAVLELVALVCGLIAPRPGYGRPGVFISSAALVLALLTYSFSIPIPGRPLNNATATSAAPASVPQEAIAGPATTQSTSSASGSHDLSEPRGLLRSYADAGANGDFSTLEALCLGSKESLALMAIDAEHAFELVRLNDAIKQTFAGQDPGIAMLVGENGSVGRESVRKNTVDANIVTTDSDHAIAYPNGGGKMVLQKINGQWKLDFVASYLPAGYQPHPGDLDLYRAFFIRSVQRLTQDVLDHKFKTYKGAVAAYHQLQNDWTRIVFPLRDETTRAQAREVANRYMSTPARQPGTP